MRVLVTGGAGFIGSWTVDRLVERGHDVVVLDNLDPQVHGEGAREPKHILGHVQAGRVRFQLGSVTDRAALERALDGVEAVIHLAAAVGVGQSMYQPHYYTDVNCNGTGLLLELLVQRREQVRKLVVASSMSLYGEGAFGCPACGGTAPRPRDVEQLEAGRFEVACASCGHDLEPRPTPESKPADITSIYAATKKHQEEIAVCFGRAYGVATFALRFFNVYGPRQALSNPYTGVAAIFLGRLLNGNEPLVFEDGEQSRDFVDVRDVARCVVLAAESGAGGVHVLNVGTGRRTTVNGVGESLAASLGLSIAPRRLGRYRAGDVRHCIADPTRARDVLGFQSERTFEQGLPALIEWCKGEKPVDRVEASLAELKEKGLVK
jgi:dTDP-L-rhamnose 4-epimerase